MGGRRLQERLAHLKGNKWRATRPLPPPAQSARMSADNTGIGRQQIAEKKVENRRVRDLIKSKGLNPKHFGYPSSEESTPLPTEDEGGEESNPSASTEESTQSNDDSQPPSTDEATQEAEAGSSSASTSATPTRSGRNVRKRSVWDPSESEEAGTSASRGTKRAKPEPSKPPLKKQPVQAATKPNKQARRAPARQTVKSAADTIDSSSASSESSNPAAAAKPLKKAPTVVATTKSAAPKPKASKAAQVPTEGGSADSEDSTLSASTSTGRRSKRTSRASMTKYSDYVVESSSKKSGPAAANVSQTIAVLTPAKDEPDETETPMETVAATAPTTPIGRKTSINESALKTPSSSSTRATKSQATPKQTKAPRATAIAKKSIVAAAIPKEATTTAKPTEAVLKPTKAPKALVIAKKTVATKTAVKSINVSGGSSNTTALAASTAPSTKATVTATKRTTKKNEPSASATAGPSIGASSGTSTGTSAASSAPRGGKRAKPTPPTELNVQVNYALITTDCPVLKEASNNPSLSPPSKRTKFASPVLSKHETENMPVSLESSGDNLDDKDLLADGPATKIFTESKKRGRKGDAATTAAANASVSPDTQLKDLYSNLQKWKSTLNNAQVPELSKTKKGTAAAAQPQPSNTDDNANQMADQIDPIKIINSFFDFQMEDSREDFEWLEAQLAVNGQRSMAVNNTMINIPVEGMTNAKHMQQWFATLLVLKMTKRISNLEYTSAKKRLLAFMSAESRSVSQTAMDNHFLAQNLYEAFYFVVTKLVDLAQKWKAEYLMVRGPNCKGTPLERIRGMWDSCWTELVQFTTEILGRMPKYPRASDNSVSFSTLFLFTIFVAKFWYGKLLLSNDIVQVAKLNTNEPAQGEQNNEFDPSVSAVTKLATFLLQSPVYSDTNEAIPEIARLLYRLVIYKEDGKLVLTSGEALDLVQQLVVIVPSADKTAHFLPHLFYLGYAALRYHLLFNNGAKSQLGRFERLDSMVIDTWVQVYSKMQVLLTVPGANNNNGTQAQWDSLASTAAIDGIIRLFNAVFAKYIANSERVETWESNEFDQMLDYFGAIRRPEQFQALSTLCSIRQIISEAVISL